VTGHSLAGYLSAVNVLSLSGIGNAYAFNSPGTLALLTGMEPCLFPYPENASRIHQHNNIFDGVNLLFPYYPGQEKSPLLSWGHGMFEIEGNPLQTAYTLAINLASWAQNVLHTHQELARRALAWSQSTLTAIRAQIAREVANIKANVAALKADISRKIAKANTFVIKQTLRATSKILASFAAASKYLGVLIQRIGTSIAKIALAAKSAVSTEILVNFNFLNEGRAAADRAVSHLVSAHDQIARLNQSLQNLSWNVAGYNAQAYLQGKPTQRAYPLLYGNISTSSLSGTQTFFTQTAQSFSAAETFARAKLAGI